MTTQSDDRKFHIAILKRLRSCSDRVAFALEQNWHEDEELLKKLDPYFLYSEWKRSYPGQSGRGNVKLCFFKMCPQVVEILKEYDSFLETGYDMSFYLDKKLVLFVLFHEYCYCVEDDFRKYFSDFLELAQEDVDVMGDLHPPIPDFVKEEDDIE